MRVVSMSDEIGDALQAVIIDIFESFAQENRDSLPFFGGSASWRAGVTMLGGFVTTLVAAVHSAMTDHLQTIAAAFASAVLSATPPAQAALATAGNPFRAMAAGAAGRYRGSMAGRTAGETDLRFQRS
jgi:hypothetical protein